MNWVDFILAAIIILAMWAGWKTGFITGAINLVIWVGCIWTGFSCYTYTGNYLQTNFSGLGVWALPLSFILIIIISRLILAFIFNRILSRTPSSMHDDSSNRILGLIPGFINGIIYASVIAFLLLTVPRGENFSAKARESKIAENLSGNMAWLGAKLSPVFAPAFHSPVIERTTLEPGPNETVILPYKVKDAKERPDLEKEMLDMLNSERMQMGLKSLAADTAMRSVARGHSMDMFIKGYFSHYTPNGKDPFDRMKMAGIRFLAAGENLALGPSLLTCHQGLMKSPGHRSNILNPLFGRVGIGIMDGGIYGLMISQEFRN